jgi:hypothetical protein
MACVACSPGLAVSGRDPMNRIALFDFAHVLAWKLQLYGAGASGIAAESLKSAR